MTGYRTSSYDGARLEDGLGDTQDQRDQREEKVKQDKKGQSDQSCHDSWDHGGCGLTSRISRWTKDISVGSLESSSNKWAPHLVKARLVPCRSCS